VSNLKENKAFQTIVGAGTLYVAWVLWRDGWFHWAFNGGSDEGFSNTQLLLEIGGALLAFTQMVGIITIGIVSGILPHLDDLLGWCAAWVKKGVTEARRALSEWKGKEKTEGQWNWRPLATIVLGWVLWTGGHIETVWDHVTDLISVEDIIPQGKPQAVIFLTTETMAANVMEISTSTKVDKALLDLGIERRRILVGQDLSKAEPWLKEAVNRAQADRPVVVLVRDGRVRVEDYSSSVDDFLGRIEGWK
jgi:hypothetical protein